MRVGSGSFQIDEAVSEESSFVNPLMDSEAPIDISVANYLGIESRLNHDRQRRDDSVRNRQKSATE